MHVPAGLKIPLIQQSLDDAGRGAWAEDLVQDVFFRLLEHMSELDRQQDVGGWLYRVTSNLAISRLRRERTLSRIQSAQAVAAVRDGIRDLRTEVAEGRVQTAAAVVSHEMLPEEFIGDEFHPDADYLP
jgi:RNA polymerase sigma factor (sigma-70 family)